MTTGGASTATGVGSTTWTTRRSARFRRASSRPALTACSSGSACAAAHLSRGVVCCLAAVTVRRTAISCWHRAASPGGETMRMQGKFLHLTRSITLGCDQTRLLQPEHHAPWRPAPPCLPATLPPCHSGPCRIVGSGVSVGRSQRGRVTDVLASRSGLERGKTTCGVSKSCAPSWPRPLATC